MATKTIEEVVDGYQEVQKEIIRSIAALAFTIVEKQKRRSQYTHDFLRKRQSMLQANINNVKAHYDEQDIAAVYISFQQLVKGIQGQSVEFDQLIQYINLSLYPLIKLNYSNTKEYAEINKNAGLISTEISDFAVMTTRLDNLIEALVAT